MCFFFVCLLLLLNRGDRSSSAEVSRLIGGAIRCTKIVRWTSISPLAALTTLCFLFTVSCGLYSNTVENDPVRGRSFELMYLVNICINVIHSIIGLPPPPPLTLVRRICPVELNYPVRSFLGSPEKEVLITIPWY